MFLKIVLLFIGGVLLTPSSLSFSEKSFSTLDLLSYYIQQHSNNNELVSTHIAQAIILAGGDVKTLTAIGQVESGFNPSARGDSKQSVTLFQIQPKHWGFVGKTIYDHARKASQVLNTVGSIKRYNGIGKAANIYETKVKKVKRGILI